MRTMILAAPIMLALMSGACQKRWDISREDPESVKDYDYRFDEDDARQIARGMIGDALSRPWIDEWMRGHGGARPLMVVGNIKNDTEDYINPDLITARMEEELLNSGRVRIKAQKDLRQELRDERLDTQFNDPETVKAVAKEVNADFILVGTMKDQKERQGNDRIINYYMVTMELIDVETGEKKWIRSEEIEKRGKRTRF